MNADVTDVLIRTWFRLHTDNQLLNREDVEDSLLLEINQILRPVFADAQVEPTPIKLELVNNKWAS